MPTGTAPAVSRASTSARRHHLGSTSARSLLLTVLGEFVRPSGRAVWTSTLLAVLHGLGVEEKAARQAIARTAAAGWISRRRQGRRTRWSLTAPGRRLLTEGAERIYSLSATAPPWDGRWLVVTVSVPESRRALRHRLQTRFAWAGLGNPSGGLWVSPHPERLDEVAGVIAELGLESAAFSFVGAFGGVGSRRGLVEQAWDLAGLAGDYRRFLDTFAARDPRSDREALLAEIRLVHAWRRFPFLDPQLPAELLPNRWIGHRAGAVFTDLHARWAEPARRSWAEHAGA